MAASSAGLHLIELSLKAVRARKDLGCRPNLRRSVAEWLTGSPDGRLEGLLGSRWVSLVPGPNSTCMGDHGCSGFALRWWGKDIIASRPRGADAARYLTTSPQSKLAVGDRARRGGAFAAAHGSELRAHVPAWGVLGVAWPVDPFGAEVHQLGETVMTSGLVAAAWRSRPSPEPGPSRPDRPGTRLTHRILCKSSDTMNAISKKTVTTRHGPGTFETWGGPPPRTNPSSRSPVTAPRDQERGGTRPRQHPKPFR